MDNQTTAFGSPVYKRRASESNKLVLAGRGTTTASVFAPMQLERKILLVILPIMAICCAVAWAANLVVEPATFVERYLMGPLTAMFVGLFFWALKLHPRIIWKPRAVLLFALCGIVFLRFSIALWMTANYGYDPNVMRNMLPWMIMLSLFCVFLIPGRRGVIAAFTNYSLNTLALLAFLVFNRMPVDPSITSDLALTHIFAHLVLIVMATVFARLRVAYGRALAHSEDLEQLALEDALTGIRNRRAFSIAFKRARARAFRKHTPVSVLVLDIDYFKAVNDELGHSVGDHALRALAGLLISELRDTDEVFRYGGEEFLILLEETSLQTAWEVGDRLRKQIKKSKLIHDRTLTVSIGAAELAEHESETDVFSRADSALYEAKRGGRDKVCIALPPSEDTCVDLK